jgi:uncharacterized protein
MSSLTVRNATKDRVLGTSIGEARSFWARGRGLMFVPGLGDGEGLIIDPCTSIHTFFMRFPLDVLYMDRENQVIRADEKMKPWRFGPVFIGSRWVVELPPGTIAATGTEPGDRLELLR